MPKTFVDVLAATPEEIAARRAQREGLLATRRARIGLLQNLQPFQGEKLERLLADVIAAPRSDVLRDALGQLDNYLARRWRDARTAPKPIPAAARKKLEDALVKRGVELSDAAVYDLWAKAQKK